jgi:hypothetical protein
MTSFSVKVTFSMIQTEDPDSSPKAFEAEDQERLDGFNAGEWGFIGIQAKAEIIVTTVTGHLSTFRSLTSPGQWRIASDSSAEHLAEVYEDQKARLREEIEALRPCPIEYQG